MKKYKILDTETGEIVDEKNIGNKRLILLEEGTRILTPSQLEYLRKKERRYHDKTPYIWANFKYNKPYFTNVIDVNIPRMIYFASFCNRQGYVMANQDIKGMLKISPNQAKTFKDNLMQQDIICIRDGKVYISNQAFYVGTLQDSGMHFIRLYIGANRHLYTFCTSTQHKHLSYIYRMIPFLNRQTNILSCNQHEQNTERIEYMSIKEFCNVVGYDPSHSSRLRTELSKFRIFGELAVGFFDDLTKLNPSGKYVIVNPHLMYGGEREQELYKSICKLFANEKEKHAI
jgi:hypothetical protein